MSIRVTCDSCRTTLRAEDRHAGKRVRCPKCREPILVPAAVPGSDDDGSEDFFGATENAASSAATKSAVSSHVDTDFEVPEPASRKRGDAPKDRKEDGGWLDLQDEDLRGESLPRERRLGRDEGEDGESTGDSEDDTSGSTRVKPRKKKTKKRARLGDEGDESGDGAVGSGWRQNLYWLLLLTLIPLCLHSAMDVRPFEERLEESLEGQEVNLEALAAQSRSVPDFLHSLAMQLPDHKVADAFLPADTKLHWVFAGLSAAAFFGLLIAMWPGARASPGQLLIAGIVTGTIGIMMLLSFQWIAMSTNGVMVRGRGILVLLFYIVKFIGFSYRCAVDPEMGFGMSFMGFVCGVGLCEEVCKALPIAFYLNSEKTSWRGACLVGLASGIGFGISEGISYSVDYYNGISGGWIYVVRFVSCVGLHALWAGAIGILMYHNQDYVSEFSFDSVFGFIAHYLLIAMVLHGVYDTFLKKEMELWALLTAGVSFGWFAFMVARARSAEAA
ncbi:PrsW family glutamic-type intramembrane protease [Planctomyces sp. SH-PL14]|uniref:PrsW family glutamic-type intramembrane protease n=1 Tax=Planctomyces sp. SH-PL14 TaxID=1632864 RepID=UPI00078DD60E|nr:PrsW family glutamic-type intramembrane protease [Planctomyces sp. SH-PL14]AMV20504.1 hypothetical protein VT03_21580 [Planctomyces sp. SH-PL14]